MLKTACMAAILASLCTGTPAATERPNILILIAEDLSAHVGAFGDPAARTPNLDRLAAQGVRFPNTFTTAGVCAPSRASLITGVHQISLGAQHMRTSTSPVGGYLSVPPPEVKAFPELLRAAGYHTFTDRKLDYQCSGVVAGSGPFTIWDAEGASASFENAPAGKPFFGLVNFFITHESAAFTPASQADNPGGAAAATAAAAARARLVDPVLPGEVSVPPYYPDEPRVREHIADFYNNVQVMDLQVGQILESLDRLDLLERTIVIWTSDHGDALPRAKRELFDSGIRVPMIIRWPDAYRPDFVEPGTTDERLISFVDLAPMVLAMAGVPLQDYLQGVDVLDPSVPPREYVFAARDRIDEQQDRVRAVRDHRYKYLRYYRPGTPGAVHIAYRDQGRIMQALWAGLEAGTLDQAQSLWFQDRPEEALYDIETDPHELDNLSGDPDLALALTRMRSAYESWRERVPDLSDVDEQAMAARFWPGGEQPVTPAPAITRNPDGHFVLSAVDQASIGYRIDDGAWQLYTTPVAVPGGVTITAKAVRYGHSESEEVSRTASADRGVD
jgi:arylsulfatase A-like enzyme